jgi:hypothetical protein
MAKGKSWVIINNKFSYITAVLFVALIGGVGAYKLGFGEAGAGRNYPTLISSNGNSYIYGCRDNDKIYLKSDSTTGAQLVTWFDQGAAVEGETVFAGISAYTNRTIAGTYFDAQYFVGDAKLSSARVPVDSIGACS